MEPNWISPEMPVGLPTEDDRDYYLGSPRVIEALIRNTVGEIYAERERESAETEPQNGPDYVETLISKAVQTLIGRHNRYIPISDVWNADAAGAGIVRSVAAAYGLTDQTPAEIVGFPIYMLLQTLLEAEELDANGEDWEHLVDGDIEKMVAAYTGAPILED